MRILVGSWPAYGHLLPMVPLIRAAQRAGHDVTVSSGSDLAATIGRLGVRVHRSGVTLAESYARMPDCVTVSELPAEEPPGFAARHLALRPEEITADAVAGALGRLLDEPSFRQAAGRVRTQIDRMPTAVAVLDDLLADLCR